MRIFDQRLLSPSRDQVVGTLRAAVEFANERVRSQFLPWPPPGLDTALAESEANRAGTRRWSGEADPAGTHAWPEAGFAWWSDPLGRKHFRILAIRRSYSSSIRELFPSFWESSPLAFIAPRSVALVERRKSRQMFVFCCCGEYGTPEALCWMGDRCGHCHDRAEEGCPLLPDWPLLLPGAGEVATILFGPAGGLAVARGNRLSLWDLQSRQIIWEDDCPPIAWMARAVCSPDGRWLAFPATDHAVVWELATGRRHGIARQPHLQPNEWLSAVTFTPDSRRLVLLSFRHLTVWAVGERGLELERTIATDTGARTSGDREARSLLVTPDGRGLLVGMRFGQVRRWNLATWRVSRWSRRLPSAVTFMAARGRTLLAVDGHAGLVRLFDLDTRAVTATVRGYSELAMTPGNQAFVTFSDNGFLFSDFASGQPLARLWLPDEPLHFLVSAPWRSCRTGECLPSPVKGSGISRSSR
jgi:hypothetical protein